MSNLPFVQDPSLICGYCGRLASVDTDGIFPLAAPTAPTVAVTCQCVTGTCPNAHIPVTLALTILQLVPI